MLVGGMKDRSRVITINIVDNRLFAHELESLDSEQIRSLKKLHHVVQSDLALICVQVSEHFDQYFVPDFFQPNASSGLVGFLVERCFLKHGREVGAAAQEELVGRNLALFWPIDYKGEVRVLRVCDPAFKVCGQCGLGELGISLLGQHEIVKVIEPLHAIVAAKDVKAVLHNLARMAKTT